MKAITFEPEWTPEHRQAIDLFKQGRSIFVTGSAGTGKTLLLNHLISIAGQHGVYCTALTGLAALNIQGTTLHKYVGCGLAKGSADQLFRTMSFSTKGRWRGTRVLFIDEVSMMDSDFFEKLDQLARRVRQRADELFGGIQLVMVGDFFQLPPVSQVAMDGTGGNKRMLFESPEFRGPAVCKVKLIKVFRQQEPELVGLLEAVRIGEMEQHHIDLLHSLQRPLPEDDIKPTKLYPLNSMADAENSRRLAGDECSGPPFTYEALDTGKAADLQYLIKNCPAQDNLVLRIGAQVIHTVNHPSHPGVVNGSRGVVVGFSDEGYPMVKYAACGLEVRMHTWHHQPIPTSPVITASRSQLPLRLGWSLSIHKSQGMSIDRLEVFLDKCFAGGQSYVAISRSTRLAGLRVHSSAALTSQILTSSAVKAFDASMGLAASGSLADIDV